MESRPSQLHKVVLITGASSGIGRAAAQCFSEQGFAVALVARNAPTLDAVLGGLPPERTTAIAYDLTDFEGLAQLVATVEARLGPIEVLVNNAGMGYTNSLEKTSVADWNRVLTLNLTAPFALTQAVLPGMRSRRSGTIINLVSIAGQRTFPNWGAYSASKSGLLAFSRTLAQEVRSDNIRVTALCPGSVDTALWESELVEADFDREAMITAKTAARLVFYAATLPQDAVLEEAVLMPGRGAF